MQRDQGVTPPQSTTTDNDHRLDDFRCTLRTISQNRHDELAEARQQWDDCIIASARQAIGRIPAPLASVVDDLTRILGQTMQDRLGQGDQAKASIVKRPLSAAAISNIDPTLMALRVPDELAPYLPVIEHAIREPTRVYAIREDNIRAAFDEQVDTIRFGPNVNIKADPSADIHGHPTPDRQDQHKRFKIKIAPIRKN